MFSMLRLAYLGVKSRVVAISDNSASKIGTSIEGIPVITVSELAGNYLDAKVIITIGNDSHQREVQTQLEELGFSNFISSKVLLEPYQFTGAREPFLVQHPGEPSILKSVVMSITTKCNLRCKHCCYLMTHVEKPQNADRNQIIASAKKLSSIVGSINTFAIVGGEPFLHPDLNEICEEIGKIDNIKFKNIITNGRIVPSVELLDTLKRNGIAIFFSDYGDMSTKKQAIEKLCKEHGVLFRQTFNTFENAPTQWFTTEFPKKHGRSSGENIEKFAHCAPCNAIVNGKFYICVYEAFGTLLNAIPADPSDCVDLLDANLSPNDLRMNLETLLLKRDILTSCDYCQTETKLVPIAEQR